MQELFNNNKIKMFFIYLYRQNKLFGGEDMKKFLERVPLFFAFVVFLAFALCLSSSYAASIMGDVGLASREIVGGDEPLKEIGATFQESLPIDTEKKEETQTVSASPSDAIGQIYEQFLSPYSAKLKYDGVYIKNSTGLNIDLASELATPPKIKLEQNDKPQVLIIHTHATESYMPEDRNFYTAADASRSTDNSKNMIMVGEAFAEAIRKGGISVIHDTTQHDHPSYTGSYSKAYNTISEYLKKYPSIKIVVDVHRDAVSTNGGKIKPTVKIDGQKAAQVMLVVGSETGSVTNFPNWKENFRLAVRFHQAMEKTYPGLARTMLFSSSRYNMHLTTGSMLLEVGTDANTLDEACYSARLAGTALLSVLNGLR